MIKERTNEIEDRLIHNLEPELLAIFNEEIKKDTKKNNDGQISSDQSSVVTNEQRLFIKNIE